jgi:ubiquinone/menaquinone biosynthesis C-methylase UbiE
VRKIGVDVSFGLLRKARNRGLTVILADAHALPFRNGAFDTVLSGNGVFRYLDYARAFAECSRVIRIDGLLCVHQYVARTEEERVAALHVTSLDELSAPARSAGFVVEKTYVWANLPVFPWVLRIPSALLVKFGRHLTVAFRSSRPEK